MKSGRMLVAATTVSMFALAAAAPAEAQQAGKKPNIVFIMGDDVGWFNLSCYHQGIMSGRTPNVKTIARGECP